MRRSAFCTGTALLGVVLASSSCRSSGYYIDYPNNPIDGVHSIAVAPVPGPATVDSYAIGDAIAAELIQCRGIERVIRPSDFERIARDAEISLTNESSVRTMARLLGVDGVLVAEITEYNPYHPPRIGIVARFFIAGSVQQSRASILDISRQGNAIPGRNVGRGEFDRNREGLRRIAPRCLSPGEVVCVRPRLRHESHGRRRASALARRALPAVRLVQRRRRPV